MEVSVGGRFEALLSVSDGEDGSEASTDKDPTDVEDGSEASTDKNPTDVELCSICQTLFYSKESSGPSHRVVDVIKAAKAGCGFCKLLRSAFEAHYNQNFVAAARKVGTIEYEARSSISNYLDRLLVEWTSPRFVENLICEILIVSTAKVPKLADSTLDLQRCSPKPEESHLEYTSSGDSLRLVKTWLQHCDAQHPICHLRHNAARKLPTRLLEIDKSSIRLRKRCELPVETLYVTLSHCWGKTPMSQLSRNSSLLEGGSIPRSELSMTFQHAASVTESLGRSYLWIDSLCIIQDSDEDREGECSRMWEVYGNSYCTIAATASRDSRQGLFRRHDAGGPVPCKITPSWDSLNSSHEVEDAKAGYHFLHCFDLIESIEASPLCQRAWVFQERLLSPRIVHFASNKIWWECRELCASETYSQGTPTILDGYVKRMFDPLSVSHIGSLEGCYGAWHWCVGNYSGCGLSLPTDKLVALAGVAREISQAIRNCGHADTYLAGLWKNRLPQELLWRHSYRGTVMRSSTYRAPSWSWASIDGEVSFSEAGKPGDFCYTELISSGVSTSVDPFGATSAGEIRVRGPLVRVKLTVKKEMSSVFPRRDSIRVMTSPSSDFKCGIYLDDWRLDKLCTSMEAYALVICRDSYNFQGLILQPTTMQTQNPGQTGRNFCRLGTFTIETEDCQRLLDISNLNKDLALVHEEDNGNGRYTISIV